MDRRVRSCVLVACVVCLCGSMAACSGSKPRPRGPRSGEDAPPNSINLFIGAPQDGDNNGRMDTLSVTLYFFNWRYQVPIQVAGSLTLILQDEAGRELHRWEIPAEGFGYGRRRLPPGPGYQFTLTLLEEPRGDALPRDADRLLAIFQPSGGARALRISEALSRMN